MPKKIDRTQLQTLFSEALEGTSFILIDGLNPFLVEINGKEYYIYIKNLSPAYFTNQDVWRVQLPIRDEFEKIKETDIPFILLGYDADNDVYTTWNPIWTKQRLNVAESVSFYSRYSLQEDANSRKEFKRQSLNNDGEVIAFPREQLTLFFTSYIGLFTGSGNYVAIGSKKRTEANNAYKIFTDSANATLFAKHLHEQSYAPAAINNYTLVIKRLLSEGIIIRSKKIFLACDKLEDYLEVIDSFVDVPEVKEMNEEWHNLISVALRAYVTFLISAENSGRAKKTESEIYFETGISQVKEPDIKYGEKQYALEKFDWEARYTDSDGKMTKIANPELLDQLRPFLDTEYRELSAAYNVIDSFYGDRFKNMELSDWGTLFNKIDWNNPYVKLEQDDNSQLQEPRRKKNSILRVEFPDGRVIQHSTAADTLAEVINTHYPDLIAEIGIIHANVPLVSKELDAKYSDYQKPIDDGWYVFTNTRTEKKRDDLLRISQELDLGLKVDVVIPDNGGDIMTSSLVEGIDTSTNRAKIKVQFPNGRVFQPNKVLETLVEVVKFAGPEKVRALNINVCGDNLITKNPLPRYVKPCKPVGDGWLCNTCSDTLKKLEQIQYISEKLNLGIVAELV